MNKSTSAGRSHRMLSICETAEFFLVSEKTVGAGSARASSLLISSAGSGGSLPMRSSGSSPPERAGSAASSPSVQMSLTDFSKRENGTRQLRT